MMIVNLAFFMILLFPLVPKMLSQENDPTLTKKNIDIYFSLMIKNSLTKNIEDFSIKEFKNKFDSSQKAKQKKEKKKGKTKGKKPKGKTKGRKSEEKDKIYQIKAGINYFIPSEKAFKDIYGGGLMFTGELSVSLWRNVDFWIEGSYFSKKGKLSFTEEETTLRMIPLGGGLRFKLLTSGPIIYAQGGLKYYLFKEKNPIIEVSDSAIGLIGKTGIFLKISEGVIFDLYFEYSYCKTKPMEIEINLGGIAGGIGIAYQY